MNHTYTNSYRCLLVNSWWNSYISNDATLKHTLSTYRNTLPRTYPSRTPLRVLFETPVNLSQNLSQKENIPEPSQRDVPAPKTLATPLSLIPPNIRVHSCPSCRSPAKELNLRRANCTKCGFDFCSDCLNEWHELKCKGYIGEGCHMENKRAYSAVNIAGNQRSRKRLRRLWSSCHYISTNVCVYFFAR